MPTYSYRCQNCQHEFDAVQRITEDSLKDCPKCHTLSLKRQITSANFILKGSGWYSDLYSGSSNKTEGSAGTSAAATTSTTGTTTTESTTSTTSSESAPSTGSSDSGGSSTSGGSSAPSGGSSTPSST